MTTSRFFVTPTSIGIAMDGDAPDHKHCKECGKLMAQSRYKREGVAAWIKRKFCNQRCETIAHRRDNSERPKVCQWCKEKFHRRQIDTWRGWNQRRYCSRDCSQAAKNGARARFARKKQKKGPGDLRGRALTLYWERIRDKQIEWVFQTEGNPRRYVHAALVRRVRAAADPRDAELILEAALARAFPSTNPKSKLLEGARRRIMARIWAVRAYEIRSSERATPRVL